MERLTQALATCRSSLATYVENPDSADHWHALRLCRVEIAKQVAVFPRGRVDAIVVQSLLDLQLKFAASGAFDREMPSEDLTLADKTARQGMVGLVAAMLMVPASQWTKAPAYTAVPEALWPAYTAWLFYAPQGFCAEGQAERYAAHILRRLDELYHLVFANRNSKYGRSALGVFAAVGNCIPLYFNEGSLRQHMELRGRLLTAWGAKDRLNNFSAQPRAGRRLRVGFINRHFGSQTETYTTLPTFEQLDPARFEVCLFAHHYRDTALEKYARSRAARFTQLPPTCEEQLKLLRAAELDVAVFGTNVTAVCHEVTQLALHRVAPLQVVNNSSCTTTGLPDIDLYVSGTLTETNNATPHFTERLGLVHGPAHAFNYEADLQEPTRRWTRDDLGLPRDAVVFVSAANYFKITPEMRSTWARLLTAVPGSFLLLHPFNPNWSSAYPIKRFRAEMELTFAAHGVGASRFVLSTNRFPSRADVKSLLAVGDVYLDTFPFGGVNSLVDPLELGLPVVTWEGETMRSRMGAALLRQLGLSETVACDEKGYLALAVLLASDPDRREALRSRIRAEMAASLFLDNLAASDLFGSVLETAFDELVAIGPTLFRHAMTPIRSAPSVPLTPIARLDYARDLLASGRAGRAADYLLAAVNESPDDVEIWFQLAQSLHSSGQKPQAVEALQVVVRLDPARIPAWSLLASLAEELGLIALASQARRSGEHLSLAEHTLPDAEREVSPVTHSFCS